MKKIALLLLVILFAATYALSAQKSFSGVIEFEMKLEGTDDPNLLGNIDNLTSHITISGNKSKSVITPNEMISVTQTWDGDKGTSITIYEVTGMGKFYKKLDAEQFKEKLKFNEFTVSYEDEFKDILGFKCQRVVVTNTNLEDDSQTEIIMYVTKQIGAGKLNGEIPGLEGYPLEQFTPMSNLCEECVVVSRAIKMTPKKIKDVEFLLPADAKNIDDDPELKKMFEGFDE